MRYERGKWNLENLKSPDVTRALKMLVTNFLSRGRTECATGSRC